MHDTAPETRDTAIHAMLPFGFEPMMRMTCRMMAAQAATQAHMIDHMRAIQDEFHGFVDHRLDEDRSSSRLFAGCFMPEEMAAIWTQFVSTAVSDYAREMNRMADLATRSFGETARDIERQAEAFTAEATHRP